MGLASCVPPKGVVRVKHPLNYINSTWKNNVEALLALTFLRSFRLPFRIGIVKNIYRNSEETKTNLKFVLSLDRPRYCPYVLQFVCVAGRTTHLQFVPSLLHISSLRYFKIKLIKSIREMKALIEKFVDVCRVPSLPLKTQNLKEMNDSYSYIALYE